MKTTTIQTMLILATSTLLMSCMGQSSNPLQKYSHLKTGPVTDEVSETQKYAPDVFTTATIPSGSEIASLKLDGPNEVNTANFVEGQEGILYFKVMPKSPKITQYAVEITDFPVNPRPIIKVLNINNIYGLQWTPPMGVIPPGQNFVTLQLKIKTSVVDATDENLKFLVKFDTITISVNRNSSVPTILGRSDLTAGIDEGQSLPYTIDIEDPASALSPKVPEMQITGYAYSNTEAFRADGSRYLRLDSSKAVNPEKRAGSATQWRFHYILQVEQLPPDRDRRGEENPLAPSVDVCFHIRAISVLQTQSDQQQICFKGRYAAQLPLLKWDNEALKEIKAGAPTILKFKILSGNNLGEVSIKDAAKQIAGLPGKKDLVCTPESAEIKAVQNCDLTWSPACIKTSSTKKFTLKVENVVGKKTKSQTFTKEMTVVPSEENCPPPAAKVPPKAPVQPVVKSKATTTNDASKLIVQGENK